MENTFGAIIFIVHIVMCDVLLIWLVKKLIDKIWLIRSKICIYLYSTTSIIIVNKNSLCFTSWMVNFLGNCFLFAMGLFFWISFLFLMEYYMNLLLFDEKYQIFIEIGYYQLKHLLLLLIESLLIIIIFVLINYKSR